MANCPHTFNPQDHELELTHSNAKAYECDTCNGFIQICDNPKCNAPNRLAASYCTTCGSKLDTESHSADDTKLVRGVNRRVNDSSEYRLDKTLGSATDEKPLLWMSGDEGIFVFTHNPDARTYQLNLYYVSGFKFQQGHGQHLTNGTVLPGFKEWTQEPLVSRQGVFISTNTALHFFPAHGYDNKYEHQTWQTSDNETILSIALNKSGNPSILIKDGENQLFILEGNAQSGEWGESGKRYSLESNVGNGAAYLVTTSDLANDYWVYDGITLIRYNTETKEVTSKSEITSGAAIPSSLEEKLERGYFTPFILGDTQSTLRSVIPVKSSSDTNARAGVLPDGTNSPRTVNNDKQHKWIKAFPSGEGFALGLPDTIKGFVSDVEKWEIPEQNTTNLPPVMMQHWFAALFSYNSAPREGTKNVSAIMFEPASQHKGNYTPEDRNRMTGTIEKSGTPIPGLPPLYSNGDMYIALQNRTTTTVYQIQVSG